MAPELSVKWVEGHVWEAESRGHVVQADASPEVGGCDQAMTPAELLVAAVAMCMSLDLSFYAQRHPEIDLGQVRTTYTWEDAPGRPSRIARITGTITFPPDMPEATRAALRHVLESCKVSRTVQQGADVVVRVEFGE